MTTMRPKYVDEMASELNVDAEKLWEKLQAEAREGHVRLAAEDNSAAAAASAFGLLGRYCLGQVQATELAPAARDGFRGLGRRLELRTFDKDKTPRRPKVEGHPEALLKYITWLRAQGDAAPERLRRSLPQLQFLYTQVVVKRALLAEVDAFQEWLQGDVAGYERDGYDMLATDYGLIRAQATTDQDWKRDLREVEEYLFGAAKAGAETRAMTQGLRQQLTEQVRPEAHQAGVKEGERRVKDELKALLDGGEGPKGEVAPGNRPGDGGDPRR